MRVANSADSMPVAWNGLSLPVPASWRPARLGLHYLYFEDEDGPAFELKWRVGAGRAGLKAALRGLAPTGGVTTGGELPRSWRAALDGFELTPLSWSLDGRGGRGAALFCPECGLVAVFQAFGDGEGPDAARCDRVGEALAGLRHHDPGPPAFRLYGLSFVAPSGFALTGFEFVPGRFSLAFAVGDRRLDVVRLAPADVLLGRGALGDVAARVFGLEERYDRQAGALRGCPAVWLARRQGRGLLDGVARWLGRQGMLAVLRHDAATNKLLGAALRARRPVDRDWLEKTAAGCVSL